MQKKIVDAVEITPEEVRNFFKSIPKEELPQFGAEMEVAQIVVTPKVSEADKQKVIDKLNGFKKKSKREVLVLLLKPFYTLKIQGQGLVVVFIK